LGVSSRETATYQKAPSRRLPQGSLLTQSQPLFGITQSGIIKNDNANADKDDCLVGLHFVAPVFVRL